MWYKFGRAISSKIWPGIGKSMREKQMSRNFSRSWSSDAESAKPSWGKQLPKQMIVSTVLDMVWSGWSTPKSLRCVSPKGNFLKHLSDSTYVEASYCTKKFQVVFKLMKARPSRWSYTTFLICELVVTVQDKVLKSINSNRNTCSFLEAVTG